MIACVPVDSDGVVDPRWGRAAQVALATLEDGVIAEWREMRVTWDSLHDTGGEGAHHARVARFLREHHVDAVVADHMGAGMARMLGVMGVTAHLGAAGDARVAVLSAVGSQQGRRGEEPTARRDPAKPIRWVAGPPCHDGHDAAWSDDPGRRPRAAQNQEGRC